MLVLVGVVVVGGIVLWWLNYRGLSESRALAQHTREVQAKLGELHDALLEIEIAARGVSLDATAQPPGSIDVPARAIRELHADVAAMVKDNPQQLDRITALGPHLDEYVEAVSRAIEAARAAPRTTPDAGLATRGAELGTIRAALDALDAEERRLFGERRAAAVRSTERMSVLGAIGLAVLVIFVTAMYVLIRRQLLAQREVAESVTRSEKFLSAVVENIPNMVFVKEAGELRFERFNRAGELLLGESREKLLGKNDYDFFPKDQADFFIQKDRETLAGKVVVDIPEEPIETPKGRRWLHTRKVPILDADGKPTYLLGISEDVTEQKMQLEAIGLARDAAEHANRELESFAYAVAHDLRAPLRSIDGFSHAVLEDHRALLPPDAIESLERVRAGANRMAEVIDSLLELSRLTRTDLVRERVDLSEKVSLINEELARANPERTVEVVIEPDLAVVGDRRLLRQALTNLLNNAWKYTAKRPDARIEVGRAPAAPGTFFVRDNGAGFDMAHKDKLFQPFQRLHAAREFEGHGIGLVTAARVFQRHGGRIWAEAAVGEGATFYFVLPLAESST
jgi:PAS domain S-box-containing protein